MNNEARREFEKALEESEKKVAELRREFLKNFYGSLLEDGSITQDYYDDIMMGEIDE